MQKKKHCVGMTKREINHYISVGRKVATPLDVYDLSMQIAGEFEYYSDRWNPAKLAKVVEMIRILKRKCEKEYAYPTSQWPVIICVKNAKK